MKTRTEINRKQNNNRENYTKTYLKSIKLINQWPEWSEIYQEEVAILRQKWKMWHLYKFYRYWKDNKAKLWTTQANKFDNLHTLYKLLVWQPATAHSRRNKCT